MSSQAQRCGRTLYDKVWRNHLVVQETEQTPALLYVDLHLIHEVTSPQAFAMLKQRGLSVRCAQKTVGTTDHSTPTSDPDTQGRFKFANTQAQTQVSTLHANCQEHGIRLYPLGHAKQGIVHVIGPELGLTQPGLTVVCGDSHTSTHGAFGALAFGIGTTEVGYVLAAQTLPARRARTMAVTIDGALRPAVTAKDVVLAVIQKIGVDGGTGHVLEYRGDAVTSMSMEARMTVCNMSIEAGARAGMIAPDDTTFAYLENREFAPKNEAFAKAVRCWRALFSDEDALFDTQVNLDASKLAPMITYGTHPGMSIQIDEPVPDPACALLSAEEKIQLQDALSYMQLAPGKPLLGQKIDVVFVGSCTNARLSDLKMAADVLRGRKIAPHVRMLVVPGSAQVRAAAEALNLHRVFQAAGALWRQPGCSMCIAMNGDDEVPRGQYAVSTSNRNFKGRQGPQARTFLAGPYVAAASAVEGCVADPRPYLDTEIAVF